MAGQLTFSYRPADGLLHGYWPVFVTDATLRTHYTQLLAAAKAHAHCRFWLLDLRDRNWHTSAFSKWFGEGFASTAHAVLEKSVFIAYVLSPAQREIACELATQAAQRACARYGVYPYFFDNEADALNWLQHQQVHDAAYIGAVR